MTCGSTDPKIPKLQMELNTFLTQRLIAAAVEISSVFEKKDSRVPGRNLPFEGGEQTSTEAVGFGFPPGNQVTSSRFVIIVTVGK